MNLQKNTKEIDLILSCCKIGIEDYVKHQIEEILTKSIDWDFVIEQSIFRRIAPLVYHNLRKIDCSAIPGEVLSKLKKHYTFTLKNNLYFWTEYRNLLRIFREDGIKIVSLKGIIFARILYHDLGLRPMWDVDILVQKNDLPKVERILFQLNYKNDLADYPEKSRGRYSYSFTYSKQLMNKIILPLEVHWNLRPNSGRIFFPNIWKRVSKEIIDQQEVLLLSAEDTLLQLCLQIKCHIPQKLILFCDVSELLKLHNADFDWSYVLKEAQDNSVQSALYFTLFSIKRLLGSSVSSGLLKKIEPGLITGSLLRTYINNKKGFFGNRRGILTRINKPLLFPKNPFLLFI